MARALVLGAETGGLAGVDNDARDVSGWLTRAGFAVDLRMAGAATRAAMLDGLRGLIADARADEACVVYFSGNGGVLELAGSPSARFDFLVPSDHVRGGAFCGVLELEWSALIAALTARTRNVAVIHDCCYAAQMVRTAHLARERPRALERVTAPASYVPGLAEDPAVYPLGNPDAVRLAAAGARDVAWERAAADGRVRGVFTEALLAEIEALGERALSWAALGRRVRERVLRTTGRQRPEIAGPIDRRVFGIDTLDTPTRIAVRPAGRRLVLAAGRVHGVDRDDVFRSADPVARTAVVIQVGMFESIIRVESAARTSGGFEVISVARAVRYTVALEVGDPATHAALSDAIARTPSLAVGDAASAMTRGRLEGDRLVLRDGSGGESSVPATPAGITQAIAHWSMLAAIQSLQRTAARFADPELALVVDRVAGSPGRLSDGAELHPADRVCVQLPNPTRRTLWFHLFAVGPGARLVGLGNTSSGIQVDARVTEVLGAVPGFGAVGFALAEPGEPSGPARPIELIALATTAPVDLSAVVCPDTIDTASASPVRAAATELATDASRDIAALPRADHAIAMRRWFLIRA